MPYTADLQPLPLHAGSLATRTSGQLAVTAPVINLVVILANKAGTPTVTPKVQGMTADGVWYDLWVAAAALSANGTAVYQIGRTATATQVTESKAVALPGSVRVVLSYVGDGATDAFDTTADLDFTL